MSKPSKTAGRKPASLQTPKPRVVGLEERADRQDRMEAALRDSELRYQFLYEENPSMYFTVCTDGTVLSVNPFGASQLGYVAGELVGRPVTEIFHPEDRGSVEQQLRVCAERPDEVFTWELRKLHRDGRLVWVREVARGVRIDPQRTVVLIVCEDITARREVEQELRRARDEMEQRVAERTAELDRQRRFLRQVIDVDPNFIFAKDREGRFMLVNQAVADAYGTTVEKLTGKRDADFNPNPDEVRRFREMDQAVMDTLEEHFIREESITDSTGAVRWLQTVKRPLLDETGKATQVLGSATDITARRDAEERLRLSEAALRLSHQELRQLAGRLLTAQEDERRSLAREMHDDLSQRLAGIALQVGRLERLRNLHEQEASELIASVRGALAQLSTDVHALSRRLHPAILSDLGLVEAIRAECAAFSGLGQVTVEFRAVSVPAEIDKNTALCFYRITQEALRNVAKHARTNEARVTLSGDAGGLTLTVEDSGVGFDAARARGVGLGLASMGERARLIDAEFTVESVPGRGTLVRVHAPRPAANG
jgi:PAS domain S-box-containing protein